MIATKFLALFNYVAGLRYVAVAARGEFVSSPCRCERMSESSWRLQRQSESFSTLFCTH